MSRMYRAWLSLRTDPMWSLSPPCSLDRLEVSQERPHPSTFDPVVFVICSTGELKVSQKHFEEAFKKVKSSISKKVRNVLTCVEMRLEWRPIDCKLMETRKVIVFVGAFLRDGSFVCFLKDWSQREDDPCGSSHCLGIFNLFGPCVPWPAPPFRMTLICLEPDFPNGTGTHPCVSGRYRCPHREVREWLNTWSTFLYIHQMSRVCFLPCGGNPSVVMRVAAVTQSCGHVCSPRNSWLGYPRDKARSLGCLLFRGSWKCTAP